MEFIWKFIVSLTLSTSLVTGVTPPGKLPQAPSHMVVAVEVRERQQELILKRRYTEPEKIETMLCYLRSVSWGETAAEDPERYAGNSYALTLRFSDGRQQTYRQHADRWASENSRPWQRIPPEKGMLLEILLRLLPGDRQEDCR